MRTGSNAHVALLTGVIYTRSWVHRKWRRLLRCDIRTVHKAIALNQGRSSLEIFTELAVIWDS